MDRLGIENYLNHSYKKTYDQLRYETGKSDRTIRDMLNTLKKQVAILFNSQEPGFRLVKPLDNLTLEELKEELGEVIHTYNDINSRCCELDQQKRPLLIKKQEIDYLIKKKENEQNKQLQMNFYK